MVEYHSQQIITRLPCKSFGDRPLQSFRKPLLGQAIWGFLSPNPANFPVWWMATPSFIQDFLLADGVRLSARGNSLLAKVSVYKIISANS